VFFQATVFEWWQPRPRHVRRLVAFDQAREVCDDSTESRLRRGRHRSQPSQGLRQQDGADEAARTTFYVTLDAGDLTREKHVRQRAKLHAGIERARSIDECISVDAAEPQELGRLQPRDCAKNDCSGHVIRV